MVNECMHQDSRRVTIEVSLVLRLALSPSRTRTTRESLGSLILVSLDTRSGSMPYYFRVQDFNFSVNSDCLTFPDGTSLPLSDPRAFSTISSLWLRSGWDTKYVYSFSWMGRPVIQLPEDLIRIQELIWSSRPDLIIETGVAHGGSLVFYAGILAAMGRGNVLGIDIEIRPKNRRSIESHELAPFVHLVEGNAVEESTIKKVTELVNSLGAERVLVILDSNHSSTHVLEELRVYSGLVSPGSYIVVCDGIMKAVAGAPRTDPSWSWDNPLTAISEFLAENDGFVEIEPEWPFNESLLRERVTYWPRAFLQKVS